MQYYVLLTLVCFATFAVANLIATLAVSVAWPSIRRRASTRSAADRARLLAWVGITPAAAGFLLSGVIATIFTRFEPRDTTETPGLVLVAAAVFAAGLFLAALWRFVRSERATRECSRIMRDSGERITTSAGVAFWQVDTPYPVAAVVGVLRPKLLLAKRIVVECTDKQIDSVIAHEIAHIARRDNMVRAALRYLPRAIWFGAASRQIQHSWAAAVEEAADDLAAGDDAARRVDLAAALVRVAQMAESSPPRWMPDLAFYEGSGLERRVERLLSAAPRDRRRFGLPLTVFVLALGLIATSDGPAAQLHALIETALLILP